MFFDGTDDEDDDDNDDDVQHDVKDEPIVDSRRRLEHNIMSSITGSRHNCEQGQPKPQLGGGAQPTTTTKAQGTTGPTPQGGRGGYHGVGGGRGGVAALHHVCTYVCMYVCMHAYVYMHIYMNMSILVYV